MAFWFLAQISQDGRTAVVGVRRYEYRTSRDPDELRIVTMPYSVLSSAEIGQRVAVGVLASSRSIRGKGGKRRVVNFEAEGWAQLLP